MTAVTAPPTAADTGGPPADSVRRAGQMCRPPTHFGAPGGQLPAPRRPAPPDVTKVGAPLAATRRGEYVPAPVPGGWLHTLGATQSHVSQQVIAAKLLALRTSSDDGPPALAGLVGHGPEWSAEAYVEGLSGSERAVLLRHLATAYPDVVRAGTILVAQWRAECAERRRVAARRKEHGRRRRRRAEAGDTG